MPENGDKVCKRPRCKRKKELTEFQLCPVHCCPTPGCAESKSNTEPVCQSHQTQASADLPKGWLSGVCDDGVTMYFNTKWQTVQYDHPGQKLGKALPRTSKVPAEKPKKGFPILFV